MGTPAWNCYWFVELLNIASRLIKHRSLVNGNGGASSFDEDHAHIVAGTAEWGPDALLTPNGIAQAERAHNAWLANVAAGAPMPQSFLSSPLSRAASTLNITWTGLLNGLTPTFKELWRESIGLHTCDHRRTRSYLAATYLAVRSDDVFICGI